MLNRYSKFKLLQDLCVLSPRITEGRDQIDRQQALAEQLEREGQPHATSDARSVLRALFEKQALYEQHLALITFDLDHATENENEEPGRSPK